MRGVVFNRDGDCPALHDALRDHERGERREYFVLNSAAEGAGTILRIVALVCEPRLHFGLYDKRYALVREPLHHFCDLIIDDPRERFLREYIEDDDVVEPIEELGAEVLFERLHDFLLGLLVTARVGRIGGAEADR